jgi:uncharacterized protein
MDKNTLVNQFSRKEISFYSGETLCKGYLYLPCNDFSCCIILANGFSGTMDWNLPKYAERFATAGFAALIFDYRFFGESGGEPRQLIDIYKQREDIQNAIQFVRKNEELNTAKIALWGTSLGGGHVISIAAGDPSFVAVIAQVPGIDMVGKKSRATIKMPAMILLKILLSALRDKIHSLFGLKPFYIKVFSDSGDTAVFTDSKLKPRFEQLMKSQTTWVNRFTPRFYFSLPRYKHGTAEKISAPLLICIADKEMYANPLFQEWVGKKAPKGEVKHYNAEHFDFYHGDTFEQAIQDQILFLKAQLK